MKKWQQDNSDGIGPPGIRASGLYALLFCGKVIYVGQSANIEARLAQHLTFYKRVIGSSLKRGAKVEHFLYGQFIGKSRVPDIYPISYKWTLDDGSRRERTDRELRLIRRLKPLLNKVGVADSPRGTP